MSLFKEQAITIRELEKLKNLYLKAKEVYYSDPNGKTLMSDDEFDALEEKIRAEDPRWSGFKAGTQKVKNIKTKVRLPVPIFSLDKFKSHNVNKWLTSRTTPNVIVSDKLDGASMEIVYENKVPTACYTRGDGKVGGNISYLIPHLKIPAKINKGGTVILRCEGLFAAAKFAKYKAEFDSARNAASGVMNRQDVHRSVKDLSVMVIQVLEPNVLPSKGLAWAKAQGFTVVPYKVLPVSKLNGQNLDTLLTKRKASSRYALDGIVITEDSVNLQPKSGNPGWSIAFKANVDVDAAPVTTVKAVEWTVSPHGLLKPVIIYEPVEWDGSSLTRATAFNAKFVNENGIGIGAKVSILRSGEIIPYIVKVVKKVRPSKPDGSFGEYTLDKKGTDYVLVNPLENTDFRVKRIARFFDNIGVEFLRENTIAKLYAVGFTNVSKFVAAKPTDFLKVPGVKITTANKLYNAIHSVLDAGIPLVTLMDASGVFARGIGTTRLEAIAERYDLLKLAALPENEQRVRVEKIPGFARNTATLFSKGAPKFLKWMEITNIRPTTKKAGAVKLKSKSLEGQVVSWTGYRDKEQEQQVIENGGQVVSFGGKTTILLYSATGKLSTKVQKAEQKGVETCTWEQLVKKFKLNR